MRLIFALLFALSSVHIYAQSEADNEILLYGNKKIRIEDGSFTKYREGGPFNTLYKIYEIKADSSGYSTLYQDSSELTCFFVISSLNTPPVSPDTGATYLVGSAPTGAFATHAKDIAQWTGSAWSFTDPIPGNYLYNASNSSTYQFRASNWTQTGGIPALNNGNSISSGLRIGTNNAKSLTFETGNVPRGRFDSIGRFHVYNLPTATAADTFVNVSNTAGQLSKVGKSTFLDGIGGGGGALSAITAATAENTINNGDKTQTWTWNSLSGQSGLKLSSTANGTTINKTQKLFESVLTGAMLNSNNVSYAGYFDNQQTVGGTYGIYARGAVAAQLEGTVNINGLLNVNDLQIRNNSGVSYIIPSSSQVLVIGAGGDAIKNSLYGCAEAFTISKKTSGSKYVYGMGMVYGGGAYYSESTTNNLVERDGGNMLLSANAGLAGGYNTFTPNYQIALAGATNNVGIGTTTPNVSAKLDVSSTTQGFAPPEMTATQASAISTTSRKLIIYVTDTNGTFTSAGLWMWNGTTWKLILAQ